MGLYIYRNLVGGLVASNGHSPTTAASAPLENYIGTIKNGKGLVVHCLSFLEKCRVLTKEPNTANRIMWPARSAEYHREFTANDLQVLLDGLHRWLVFPGEEVALLCTLTGVTEGKP